MSCKCYASLAPRGPLEPFSIDRRPCSANDVQIEIKFCGICHSDIHQVNEDWGPATFPMVPGHEIVGICTAVGANVKGFKIGDVCGVGCMVDSCRGCGNCKKGVEQYCSTGCVFTYNSSFKYPHCVETNADGGAKTYGGYSQSVVVDHTYVLKVPNNLDMAAATPLLCAGITVYSPMKAHGLTPDMKFGVIGLGGLGHMGVKFAKAFGNHVTVFSRGTNKKETALAMGADKFVDTTNEAEMTAATGSVDFIINTLAADHDLSFYMRLLGLNGKMIVVSVPPSKLSVHASELIFGAKTIAGSLIGGIKETQEMLDFCGEKGIVCDIETIKGSEINEAYARVLKSDVKYRFVIDIASF